MYVSTKLLCQRTICKSTVIGFVILILLFIILYILTKIHYFIKKDLNDLGIVEYIVFLQYLSSLKHIRSFNFTLIIDNFIIGITRSKRNNQKYRLVARRRLQSRDIIRKIDGRLYPIPFYPFVPRYPCVSLNWIKTRRGLQFPRRKIELINFPGMRIDQL